MEITIACIGTAKRFQEFVRSEQERYPNATLRGKASLGICFLKKDNIEIRYVFCLSIDKLRGNIIHFILNPEPSFKVSFKGFRELEVQSYVADRNIKSLCKDAFLESFGYKGLHPAVELVYFLCKQFGVLHIYEKAYEEYYE